MTDMKDLYEQYEASYPVTQEDGTIRLPSGQLIDGDESWCLLCEATEQKPWRFTEEQAERIDWIICDDHVDMIGKTLDYTTAGLARISVERYSDGNKWDTPSGPAWIYAGSLWIQSEGMNEPVAVSSDSVAAVDAKLAEMGLDVDPMVMDDPSAD
jgi:hypothetical protein